MPPDVIREPVEVAFYLDNNGKRWYMSKETEKGEKLQRELRKSRP